MWQEINKDTLPLIKALEALTIRKDILYRVVHWQLARKRSGTHETKEEAEVRGSGKKMFRQKGTGRARQGARRAPHMRGGAIIFGPHNRDYSYSLNKKVRQLGLRHAVAAMLKEGDLKVYQNLELGSYKLKDVKQTLEQQFGTGKKILFVDSQNDNLSMGIRNLIGVNVIPACGLNVYDILKHDVLVFSQSAFEETEQRLTKGVRAC